MIEEVGTFIANNVTLTAWNANNVKLSRLPDNPDLCLALYEYGGTPDYTIGGGVAKIHNAQLQVLVRATDFSTAWARLREVSVELEKVGGQTLSSVYYHRILAATLPTQLEPDSADRIRITQNFDVMKEPS